MTTTTTTTATTTKCARRFRHPLPLHVCSGGTMCSGQCEPRPTRPTDHVESECTCGGHTCRYCKAADEAAATAHVVRPVPRYDRRDLSPEARAYWGTRETKYPNQYAHSLRVRADEAAATATRTEAAATEAERVAAERMAGEWD